MESIDGDVVEKALNQERSSLLPRATGNEATSDAPQTAYGSDGEVENSPSKTVDRLATNYS